MACVLARLWEAEHDLALAFLQFDKKDLGVEVACLDVGDIPPGRQRSSFLAVGGWDQAVRLLSLDPGSVFQQRALQALPSPAHSVCLAEMRVKAGLLFFASEVAISKGTPPFHTIGLALICSAGHAGSRLSTSLRNQRSAGGSDTDPAANATRTDVAAATGGAAGSSSPPT